MLLEAPYKAAADHFIQGSLQKHLQHEGHAALVAKLSTEYHHLEALHNLNTSYADLTTPAAADKTIKSRRLGVKRTVSRNGARLPGARFSHATTLDATGTIALAKSPLAVGDVTSSPGNMFFDKSGRALYAEPPAEMMQRFEATRGGMPLGHGYRVRSLGSAE